MLKTSRRRCVAWLEGELAADSAPAAVCKRYLASGIADLFRTGFRGSYARWEASRIHLAEQRGVPTASLLGFSEEYAGFRVRESRLLTVALQNTCTVGDWLPPTELSVAASEAGMDQRLPWLYAVADLLATLHGCGLRHGDLHAGNILMRRDADGWHCWLIDLAALRDARTVPRSWRIENVARFCLSVKRLCTAREIELFLGRYWRQLGQRDPGFARAIGQEESAAITTLSRQLLRPQVQILRRADLHWSRGSTKIRQTAHGRCLASLGPEWADALSTRVLDWWQTAVPVESTSFKEVRRLTLSTRFGERSFLITRFATRPDGRENTARQAWEAGHAAHRRCQPVAVPWGYVELPSAQFLVACEPEAGWNDAL